jgi:hypothetical protein
MTNGNTIYSIQTIRMIGEDGQIEPMPIMFKLANGIIDYLSDSLSGLGFINSATKI